MAHLQRIKPVSADPLAKALDGIELVIFDFDGVIADSEVLSLGTLQDALADCGLPMALEQVRSRFLGTSLGSIADYVARHGIEGASKGFAERWESTLYGRLSRELRPMSAISPFLDCLNANSIRYCVASSSSFQRISLSVAAMALEDRFPHRFSADQVQNGKPAPDLFLFAAAQMNTDPDACLVVEDSPYGIQGARSAGMRAFGFVDGAHLSGIQKSHSAVLRNAGAERILTGFEELLPKTRHENEAVPLRNAIGER